MNRCCPQFNFPCIYGNTEQTYTKECDRYWLNGEEQTVVIPENTVFSPNCTPDANALAQELAQYEAESLTACDTCCLWAVCVSLPNPADAQNLVYWDTTLGILFSAKTTVCISWLYRCPDFDVAALFSIEPLGEPALTTPISPTGGCALVSFEAGVLYPQFGFGPTPDSASHTEDYSIGWDCDLPCPPKAILSSATSFPFGITRCKYEE